MIKNRINKQNKKNEIRKRNEPRGVLGPDGGGEVTLWPINQQAWFDFGNWLCKRGLRIMMVTHLLAFGLRRKDTWRVDLWRSMVECLWDAA